MPIMRTLYITPDDFSEDPADQYEGHMLVDFGNHRNDSVRDDITALVGDAIDKAMQRRAPALFAQGYSHDDEYLPVGNSGGDRENPYWFDAGNMEEVVGKYQQFERYIPLEDRLFIYEGSVGSDYARGSVNSYYVLPLQEALAHLVARKPGDTKPKRLTLKRRLMLDTMCESIMTEYEAYINGDMWTFDLHEHAVDDENWYQTDPIDSCGGFIGYDYEDNGILEHISPEDRIDMRVVRGYNSGPLELVDCPDWLQGAPV